MIDETEDKPKFAQVSGLEKDSLICKTEETIKIKISEKFTNRKNPIGYLKDFQSHKIHSSCNSYT